MSSDSFTISRTESDGTCEIVVYGDLDEGNAPDVETLLDGTALDVPTAVDLTNCTYICSLAISAFVRAYKVRGRIFKVIIPSAGIVNRIFTISGLIGSIAVTSSASKGAR